MRPKCSWLGWATSHAANLLGALGDARAIPGLLRVLEWGDGLDPLSLQIIDALTALGPLAIESCLETYATTGDDGMRDCLAIVLSRCGTRDERIYERLLDTLER